MSSNIIFMALCLWREARGESVACRIAIAYVIMNRVLHPKWGWKSDIMQVIFMPMQFSSLTDPKDKQLTLWPASNDVQWLECVKIAEQVVYGDAINPIGAANHYYDISIPAPYWAKDSNFIIQIDNIKFYAL